MMNALKSNLLNNNDNENINFNFSQMAKQLKTFRNPNSHHFYSKVSNFEEDPSENQCYNKLNTHHEGTKNELNLMISFGDPKTNKNNDINKLSSMKRKLSIKKNNSTREKLIYSKNSMTVLSKTTKENTVIANPSSPKKLNRCSLNLNDIDGPEELHYFNIITSQNNKALAKKFDRNLENFDDELSDWSF